MTLDQTTTTLADRMRARADEDALPADHALRKHADAFDTATRGFYAQPQTVKVAAFVGAWARARRAWCDYTGEPLI